MFANSLPNTEVVQTYFQYPKDIVRTGYALKEVGLPNSGMPSHDFLSLDQLLDHYAHLKVCFRTDGTHTAAMKPRKLEEYCSNLFDVHLNRSQEHEILDSHHTLEIRDDCTQPLKDCFSVPAFNLGIALNYEQASEIMDSFFNTNHIQEGYDTLRYKAVNDQFIAPDTAIEQLLEQLVRCAKEGLQKHCPKYMKYLSCLEEHQIKTMSPARMMKMNLETGCSIMEWAKQCSFPEEMKESK